MNSEEQFRVAMRDAGLDYGGPIVADRRLHRFRAAGDHARNSWYFLYDGTPATGVFGCWKRGTKETWHDREAKKLTTSEQHASRQRIAEAEAERKRVEKLRQRKAQKTAAWILSRSAPADGSHAYLANKGVQPHGELRQWRGKLVIPLRDAGDELHSLQFIGADGSKLFLAGGRVAGCFFALPDNGTAALVICEGYATGASIVEATGLPTVAAMNCGNLLAVATALRAKWPQRDIIIAADNDQLTKGNLGVTKATEAAKAIYARLAVPYFKDTSTKPTDFNDLAKLEGSHAVKDQIEAGMTLIDMEWAELKPLPNDLPAVPAFAFDCLPGTLRPWIEDISERMQCPPDFPAVGAMIALGSLIGRKVGIRPKRCDDWLVIPNLWGCVVGRPGVMKTPAVEQPLLPLRRLVAEALERYEAEVQQHKVNVMLTSQRAKLAEKKIAKCLKAGNEQAARAEAEAAAAAEPGEPILRRYEVNDSTVAKLGELLAQNPNGLLIHRDELVGFLRGLDKEGNEEARAFYLEAWNGTGSFTFDRIGRGTIRVESNTLALLGGIQPDLLSGYVREAVRGGVGADGLLQRFQLAVWPDISKQWLNVDRWPDTKARNEAFAVFKYLDELTPKTVYADESSGIPFLRFAPDAQDRFDQWRAALEMALRSDAEHPAFEAHLSKYRKLVPALAVLIHLANHDTGPVSLVALSKALHWAVYLEAHARRIYSAVLRPDTAAARELAKHLQRGELAGRFTLRETYRKGWAGLATKDDAEAATEILCDLGWIRPIAEAGRTAGRPASPSFEINPKIRKCTPNELTELTKPISGGSGGEDKVVSLNSQRDQHGVGNVPSLSLTKPTEHIHEPEAVTGELATI